MSAREDVEAQIQAGCRWRTEGHTSWVELESLLDWLERVRAAERERVVGYLRELRDAADMPMHHQADIDQFLVEVLGVWDNDESTGPADEPVSPYAYQDGRGNPLPQTAQDSIEALGYDERTPAERERDALAAQLESVVAVRDRLAQGDTVQTHAAEYITDALNDA